MYLIITKHLFFSPSCLIIPLFTLPNVRRPLRYLYLAQLTTPPQSFPVISAVHFVCVRQANYYFDLEFMLHSILEDPLVVYITLFRKKKNNNHVSLFSCIGASFCFFLFLRGTIRDSPLVVTFFSFLFLLRVIRPFFDLRFWLGGHSLHTRIPSHESRFIISFFFRELLIRPWLFINIVPPGSSWGLFYLAVNCQKPLSCFRPLIFFFFFLDKRERLMSRCLWNTSVPPDCSDDSPRSIFYFYFLFFIFYFFPSKMEKKSEQQISLLDLLQLNFNPKPTIDNGNGSVHSFLLTISSLTIILLFVWSCLETDKQLLLIIIRNTSLSHPTIIN
ncbi:hypothetical protein VP01_272g2 [Puccinia sorghi]|uniref:Uncharacterized protein n=1 Tax=Puccinia sorghi TaxID=27349 RepID=A0A0L6V385_9BASI|nr:hypothetical protein VP01_272g2 [Puccinia sorghi]